MIKRIFTLGILAQLSLSALTFAQTKVVAHRGAWKNTAVPQNSIAALKEAIKMGCDGSEFDVHMSADSVIFVNHDAHIQGIPMETTSSQVLSAIKLENGESLPTLEAYLKAGLKQKKTRLVLEIKPSAVSKERGIALARKVVEVVNATKAASKVDYISFDYEICKEITRIAPKATVQYLNGNKAPDELLADGVHGLDYHFSVLEKNPTWIKDANSKKLITNAWTVNDEKVMDRLIAEGIKLITTDEPELLLKKLRK